MWSTSNDYGLSNIGTRTLGDYTEQQRQVQLAYQLASQLAANNNGQVYANIDLPEREIKLAEGSDAVALAYGLKPYIVAPRYDATSLVPQNNFKKNATLLGNHMKPEMLRGILRQIVEDA